MTFLLMMVLTAVAVPWLLVFWQREARQAQIRVAVSAMALMLVIPVLAVLLYGFFGYRQDTTDWLSDREKLAPLVAQIIAGDVPTDAAIADIPPAAIARVLQRALINNPSTEGWYALALLYSELEAPVFAIKAARRALAHDGNRLPPRVLLARILMEEAEGVLTAESRALLESVLHEHPDHDGAWMLLAMGASQQRDYALATRAWEALLARHGDSEAASVLERSVVFARTQQARAKVFVPVSVTVEASESIRPGGTLFVFLREQGSAGQPLAARRMLASSFPMQVTVDHAHWLLPYPEPTGTYIVGARYAPAQSSGVDDASHVAPTVVLDLAHRAPSLTLAPVERP